MAEIWTMGEMLVEIMRPGIDMEFFEPGHFVGPFPSGAPAIFIDTVARLGVSAGIIGGVGEDDFGRLISERLEKDGVDCRFVVRSGTGSTAVAFVMYRKEGSRNFIFHLANTPAILPKAPDIATIGSAKYFHVMGCSLTIDPRFRLEIIKTMNQFTGAGAKISFDPNIRPELLRGKNLQRIIAPIMANCSVFLPGVEELLLISETSDIDSAVRTLFCNPKLEIIALKRGKNGSTVYTRDDRMDFGIYDVKPVDPTGAGDSFDGAFIAGLVQGHSIADCTRAATAAASLNTAAFGPMEGDISADTVHRMMADNSK